MRPVPVEALGRSRRGWRGGRPGQGRAHLGQALATFVLCYMPRKIVIGGGVGDHLPLLPPARIKLAELLTGYLAIPEMDDLDAYVVGNSLDGDQGILGCLELARARRRRRGRRRRAGRRYVATLRIISTMKGQAQRCRPSLSLRLATRGARLRPPILCTLIMPMKSSNAVAWHKKGTSLLKSPVLN